MQYLLIKMEILESWCFK